jgi:hypothetical protein
LFCKSNGLGAEKLMFLSKRIPALLILILSILSLGIYGCVDGTETQGDNYAGLIVKHADGSLILKCINFQEDEITGEELLNLSDIPYIADVTNPMGSKVCSIDGQGCDFPAEKCFCQCGNIGPCTYWAYFALNVEGDWVYAPVGAKGRKVHHGDVDAWAWLTGASKDDHSITPTLPEVDFETICREEMDK